LRLLLNQDYPELTVCAVDDRSSDMTGSIMDGLQLEFSEKLRVIHITELPPRWLGKTHAMWLAASQTQSHWILFTDGDIFFRSDALRRAFAYVERKPCDHLMLFPTMIMKSFGERMMMSFFGFISIMLVRPWKVRDPASKAFVGAGSFNMIRRGAYEALGTYEALRMEVIDDLMLGRAVKERGLRQDCAFGVGLVSVYWAQGTLGVARNMQKNLFSLLGFNWRLLVLVVLGATLYHLGPWIGLAIAPGTAKLGFGIAVVSIALLYAKLGAIFEVPFWFFLTQPVAAILLIYALLNSAISSLIHGGVQWRGTTYGMDEIRAFRLKQEQQKLTRTRSD
jgi:glycosyltransferase involved in cell wall biosynthesis